MPRPVMSTLTKRARRDLKERSKSQSLKHQVYTSSDFLPLRRKIKDLQHTVWELENSDCSCDWVICTDYCCSDCMDYDLCARCSNSQSKEFELGGTYDLLFWLEGQYDKNPTYSADETSTKGVKKDPTCWNHEPRARLGRLGVKRLRAKARDSKSWV